MKRIFLYCFANSLSFCILASQELGSLMKDNLSLYQLSDETKEKIRERVRSFNRNRNRDKGVYAISLATGYRPYYALWRIFAGAEPSLFIRTLATTLDDALSRAMHLLQNCNVALALVENAFFEPFYGMADDIMPFGMYKGKRLAEIYYLAPSYVLWLANKFTPSSKKYNRLIAFAKAFAFVHFELTVQKRKVSSVSHFVGDKGDKLFHIDLVVLNVRLQVDTYKPDFYVDQNVLAADRDGNRFTFLVKAAGSSLTPKVLHCRSRKIEQHQQIQLASAKIMGHYERHGVKYTRLGYVRLNG